MFSCTEMETTHKTVNQKEMQSPTICRDFVVHESGRLVPSCKKTMNLKGIKMPPICMNFVVDETLALSDNQFETAEYKECKTIVLEKLRDRTKE